MSATPSLTRGLYAMTGHPTLSDGLVVVMPHKGDELGVFDTTGVYIDATDGPAMQSAKLLKLSRRLKRAMVDALAVEAAGGPQADDRMAAAAAPSFAYPRGQVSAVGSFPELDEFTNGEPAAIIILGEGHNCAAAKAVGAMLYEDVILMPATPSK